MTINEPAPRAARHPHNSRAASPRGGWLTQYGRREMPITTTRTKRRKLAIENAKWPAELQEIPEAEWRCAPVVPKDLTNIFRSRDFLVQVYVARAPAFCRLTIGRTVIDEDSGRWRDKITWDELMRLKRECGFGAYHAVEVFPADCDLVDVANLRHLWVLHYPPSFAWRKRG